MKKWIVFLSAIAILPLAIGVTSAVSADTELWDVYNKVLKKAKYVDLTHAFSPTIAVWPGFGSAKFKPAVAGREYKGYCKIGEPFDYKKHGFIA
ncbi:MAG: cyclase family protein, partial [Deltaproteobacteria bacterium]|nr:cyclase family protein [Deltaproteobacteria bacterium]